MDSNIFMYYESSTEAENLVNQYLHLNNDPKLIDNISNAEDIVFYREGLLSVYLAKYDGVLMWTLSHHYGKDEWDNISTLPLLETVEPSSRTLFHDVRKIAERALDTMTKIYKQNMPREYETYTKMAEENNYKGE